MLNIINGKGRYLLAVALVIMLAFGVYFYFAFEHAESRLVEEKYAARIMTTNVLCVTIDAFVDAGRDWGVYDYDAILASVAAYIDASGRDASSYAELFDSSLNSLSERTPYYSPMPFNPHDHPELIEAVLKNEIGHMTIQLEHPGDPHNIYLYYRWIPTDPTQDNRLLLIAGITKHSVNHHISQGVKYGAAALMVITTGFIVWTTMLLVRLGSVHDMRGKDKKWRAETSL
jgi:hypothetical protein